VLDYLGRYTQRVAISNGRLRALDPSARTVAFAYKDHADGDRLKTLTLSGVEFIRGLGLHLLPPRFTKIGHYGLLGNNCRHHRVPLARTAQLTSPLRFAPKTAVPPAAPALPPLACPHCQGTDVRCIGRVERSGKVSLFARVLLSRAAPLRRQLMTRAHAIPMVRTPRPPRASSAATVTPGLCPDRPLRLDRTPAQRTSAAESRLSEGQRRAHSPRAIALGSCPLFPPQATGLLHKLGWSRFG
jgi:hypothetical protein